MTVTGTVPFSKLSDEWKKDAAFVAEYECIGPDMELAFALSEARLPPFVASDYLDEDESTYLSEQNDSPASSTK